MSIKTLKLITQTLLFSVIVIVPFFKIDSLYFPFVSGKVYLFRALVMLAFFFWFWLFLKEREYKPNFKNLLVLSLILFFLAQALVSFFGINPVFSFFSGISRHEGVFQYGFWVLYFLMLVSILKKERDWQVFFSVFVIIAFLISFFAWLNYLPNQEIYGNFFGNPAYFCGFLIFAIGFSLLLAFDSALASTQAKRRVKDEGKLRRRQTSSAKSRARKEIINYIFLILAGFFAITLVFTQIRGALIGLVGGIFLFCFLSVLFLRGEEDKSSSSPFTAARVKENPEGPCLQIDGGAYGADKKLGISCFVVLLIGLSFLIFLFSARETEFVKNTPFLSRLTEIIQIKEGSSARERLLVWNIALKAFKEKPIFGYGPENFASAVNKYYDHELGERETWFDRAHNVPLEVLATGGLILFSFYLFWILAVFYLIFKISKEKKKLSFLLASIFTAYFLQGLFLFDSLAVFLGLFPFMAFLVFIASRQTLINADEKLITADSIRVNQPKSALISGQPLFILVPVAFLSLFIIYTTVFLPWRANNAVWQFFSFTEAGLYKEAKPVLEKSFAIKSPYTYWPARKEAGWQFLRILEDKVEETMPAKDIQTIKEIYDFIVPELESFIESNPYEPQMYYVLARTYQAGFEKLGRQDLEKAEMILKKALNYSDLRREYFEELSKVMLLQGKLEEGERLVQDYLDRADFYDYFSHLFLGHFYFEAERYGLAIEQYEKARELGYDFCQIPAEYSRYMFSAEQTGEYQKIVEMAKEHLKKQEPTADTYFNISVGYLNLGEKEKAREFFLKAVELNPEYEKYQLFFLD